jgi:hypothetical protein
MHPTLLLGHPLTRTGLFCAAVLLISISSSAPAATLPAANRPNVILFIADDVSWDDLGCTGNPTARTPHLDRLRAEGVDAPVIVGGIIPEEDRTRLANEGVAAVYTPKDFDIARIMQEVAELAAAHRN